jgi:predicted Zn-ribbon and HTH transcriptional regulator
MDEERRGRIIHNLADWRNAAGEGPPARRERCEKCGFVYTDDPDVDRSRCSQCGKSNEAIEF